MSSLVLVVSLTAAINLYGQAEPEAHEVVAKVSGTDLTFADLQQKEGGKLLQAEYQYYVNERKALDDLIDNRLLADEARKRNMSLDQLLETEVYKGVKDPTEDQLEVYYEGLDTQQPYESVREDVLQHIRELRRTKARAAFVENLRKEAKINILLMPPSADVDISKAYANGSQNAPVVLVEFADYECPYCQKVNPQIQQLKKEYRRQSHGYLSRISLCPCTTAPKRRRRLLAVPESRASSGNIMTSFSTASMLEVDALKEHARVLKLDGDRFDTCLDSGARSRRGEERSGRSQRPRTDRYAQLLCERTFLQLAFDDYDALKDIVNQQLSLQPQYSEPEISKK